MRCNTRHNRWFMLQHDAALPPCRSNQPSRFSPLNARKRVEPVRMRREGRGSPRRPVCSRNRGIRILIVLVYRITFCCSELSPSAEISEAACGRSCLRFQFQRNRLRYGKKRVFDMSYHRAADEGERKESRKGELHDKASSEQHVGRNGRTRGKSGVATGPVRTRATQEWDGACYTCVEVETSHA